MEQFMIVFGIVVMFYVVSQETRGNVLAQVD